MTKLQNAYDTISDPDKRRVYNLRWPGIRDSQRAQQESQKQQAEAAQAERKTAAEARTKKQEEDNARQERLRNLESARGKYDGDIFELARAIRKLAADLQRLKDQDDEDIRKEKERNSWWTYLSSPLYGKAEETDEQKQQRETKRLDRQASRRIRGSELAEKEARMQRLQDALRGVNVRIAAEKKRAEDEKRRAEEETRARRMKAEQEARDRAMKEAWERMVKEQKERDERAAKAAEALREAREAREALERARAAAAEERRRKEAEEQRAQALRRADEAARKARQARDEWSGLAAKKSTCRHEGWWPKVEGKMVCGKCFALQSRFALKCPGCGMLACANCQKVLRGGRWKGGGDDGFEYDVPFFDYD